MKYLISYAFTETKKLWSDRKYKVLLILPIIISILAVVIYWFSFQYELLSILFVGNYALRVLDIFISVIIPLYALMAAADLITSEKENGSAEASLLEIGQRNTMFYSKTLAIIGFGMLLIGVLFLGSSIVMPIVSSFSLNTMLTTFLVHMTYIFPLTMITLFSTVIASYCKSSSSTIVMGVGLYLIMSAVGILNRTIGNILPTEFMKFNYIFSYSGQTLMSYFLGFISIIAYSIIFLSIGSYIMYKTKLN